MSLLEHEFASNDAELISQVRAGDLEAYGELFARHKDAANRLARTLTHGSEADDLVSDAFNKVLNVLLKGGGPDIAFRAYLLTSVRRQQIDRLRSQKRDPPTDDLTPYDSGVHFDDPVISEFEGGAATKAFASLPERWQMVLWHLEVEKQKPAEIAPLLGMSANSVSALAYRAREGLRQAFLNEHAQVATDSACQEIQPLLGAHVRRALSKRDTAKVEEHLDDCRKCMAAYLELADVNKSIGAVIAPVVLGSAAIGYLATTGQAAAGIGLGAGLGALLGRARDAVVGNGAATAAAAVATVVVTGAVVTGTISALNKPDPAPSAKPAVPSSQGPSQSQLKSPAKSQVSAPEATQPPAPPLNPSDSETATLSTDHPKPSTHQVPAPAHPSTGPSKSHPATTINKPTQSPGSRPTGPSSPTSSNPTPSNPTPTKSAIDVSVQSDAIQAILAGGYRVIVNGVPPGGQAIVNVHVTGTAFAYVNLLILPSGPCTGPGDNFTCIAGPGQTTFHFTRVGFASGSMMATITSHSGYEDSNPGNDSASLTLY